MPSPARLAVGAGIVVLVLGALVWWRPFADQDRRYPAAIPQPAPLFSQQLLELDRGEDVCFGPTAMDTHSEVAEFRASTMGRATGEPLGLTITGPGYRFAASAPAGYPDNAVLTVPVRPPPRAMAIRVCIENRGRRRTGIFAATDRTRAPYRVEQDGTSVGATPQFYFYERELRSIADRLPLGLDRMDVFRPGFLAPWLFWPLAVLTVLGAPLGALWALWHAAREDEASEA